MKLTDMAKNVDRQTISIPFIINGEEEMVEIEPLKKLEWAKIQNDLDKNMWKKIIDATAAVQEGQKNEIGMASLLGELDEEIQIAMWYQKLKKLDSDLTKEQADDLLTYGIESQEQYMRGLLWLFQGVDVMEEVEELENVGGSKNPEEDSEDES